MEQHAEPPARQAAVLEAALRLLVEGGERAVTTAGVARAARCSKESLYRWFGDREGLLAAMVAFQASKVRAAAVSPEGLDADRLRAHLESFGRDLLAVLAGDVSLALNRLAIGNAGHADSRLGAMVIARGRRAVEERGGALLEAARGRGLVAYDDLHATYETLYGLIVRDMHVRLLLGDDLRGGERDFARHAAEAVDQFLQLYAAGGRPDKGA